MVPMLTIKSLRALGAGQLTFLLLPRLGRHPLPLVLPPKVYLPALQWQVRFIARDHQGQALAAKAPSWSGLCCVIDELQASLLILGRMAYATFAWSYGSLGLINKVMDSCSPRFPFDLGKSGWMYFSKGYSFLTKRNNLFFPCKQGKGKIDAYIVPELDEPEEIVVVIVVKIMIAPFCGRNATMVEFSCLKSK